MINRITGNKSISCLDVCAHHLHHFKRENTDSRENSTGTCTTLKYGNMSTSSKQTIKTELTFDCSVTVIKQKAALTQTFPCRSSPSSPGCFLHMLYLRICTQVDHRIKLNLRLKLREEPAMPVLVDGPLSLIQISRLKEI